MINCKVTASFCFDRMVSKRLFDLLGYIQTKFHRIGNYKLKSRTNTCYRYIKVQNIYINSDLKIINLIYLLWFNANPFGFSLKPKRKISLFIPFLFIKIIKVSRLVLRFIISKYVSNNNHSLYSYSYGHLALKRERNNYSRVKIFDLEKFIVTTYEESLDKKAFINCMNKLRELESNYLAPTIHYFDTNHNYYIEKYLNYKSSEKWQQNLQAMCSFINKINKNYPIKKIYLKDYMFKIEHAIPSEFFINKLLHQKAKEVLFFINTTKEKILKSNEKEILLSLSHGDLSRNNIMISEDETLAIDWERSKYRPILYDLFFGLTIVKRNCFGIHSMHNYISDIKRAINVIEKNDNSFIPKDIAIFEMYLYLFYIEYLSWRIDVRLFYLNEQDACKRIEELLKHIDYFIECEPYIIEAIDNEKSNFKSSAL